MSEGYPPLIRLYLRACLIEAARPVVLRFDRDGVGQRREIGAPGIARGGNMPDEVGLHACGNSSRGRVRRDHCQPTRRGSQ